MKLWTKIGICSLIFAATSACEKESDFPDEPVLKTRSFVRKSEAVAVWRIGFTDGNGDLGVRNDSDPDNFFVRILIYKNAVVDTIIEGENYRIPVVKGIRTAAGVEGEIAFEIDGIDFFKAAGYDSLQYTGFAVDRSKDTSNVVKTPIFTSTL